jgi:hypothetical protein
LKTNTHQPFQFHYNGWPMNKLRTISLWRWASGLGFGLLVLTASLPNAIVIVHDAQGRSTGQSRFDLFMTGWVVGYIGVAVGCILIGRCIATIIGLVMLAVALFSI